MNNSVKLTFIGDIMCKADMLNSYKGSNEGGGGYDFSSIFEHMKDYFINSDLVLGNMETPISMSNTELTSEKYSFNSPYEFAKAAYDAGVDFVATANNHCLDRGVLGIGSTIESLTKIGLLHTGIFNDKYIDPLIINVNGLKIGIMSYTYGTNAFSNNCYLKRNEYWRVNLFQNQELSNKLTRWAYHNRSCFIAKVYNKMIKIINPDSSRVYERKEFSFRCKRKLKKDIKKMKAQDPDFVVMYMHAGGQYNPQARSKTKKLSKFLIKEGIDIVAGSHEHVVHGGCFDNVSNNKIETYSLGNFCGVSGTLEEPFDKMSEYSIAMNVYISLKSKQVEKVTYSVLKTIKDEKKEYGVKTVPVFELINMLNDVEEKKKLWSDIVKIAKDFSGMNIIDEGIRKEYVIYNA